MTMIGLPRTQFHLLLVQGVPQGDVADGAIRSAVATAMRRNRAYMLMHHRTMPGHERYIVNTAKRLLRDHIAMDRLFAFGVIERRQRHNKHYESLPASRADFIDRWGNLCDTSYYTTIDYDYVTIDYDDTNLTLSSTRYHQHTTTPPLLHHYYTTTTTPIHRRRCHPDTRARTRTRANPNPSRGEEASQSYQQ